MGHLRSWPRLSCPGPVSPQALAKQNHMQNLIVSMVSGITPSARSRTGQQSLVLEVLCLLLDILTPKLRPVSACWPLLAALVLGAGSPLRVAPRGAGTRPLRCPALAWAELTSQTSASPVQGWFGIAPDAEVRGDVALKHLAVGAPPGAGAGGLAQVRILEAWFNQNHSCSLGTVTLRADAGGSPALKHRVSLIGDRTSLLPSRILTGIRYLFSY